MVVNNLSTVVTRQRSGRGTYDKSDALATGLSSNYIICNYILCKLVIDCAFHKGRSKRSKHKFNINFIREKNAVNVFLFSGTA